MGAGPSSISEEGVTLSLLPILINLLTDQINLSKSGLPKETPGTDFSSVTATIGVPEVPQPIKNEVGKGEIQAWSYISGPQRV